MLLTDYAVGGARNELWNSNFDSASPKIEIVGKDDCTQLVSDHSETWISLLRTRHLELVLPQQDKGPVRDRLGWVRVIPAETVRS